jgi:glutamate dehydrogenase (NAD(P)+)
MAWMMDTYSQTKGYAVRKVVTGKPLIIGGTLGQHDATGRSVVYTIIETAEKLKMEFNANVRVVIQGFGKLGRSAFRKLENMGCTIIAINDIRGGVFNNQGLNYEELYDWAAKNRGSVEGFKGGESLTNEELLTLPCEILITAATADQITDKNATKVKAKIIAEAANEAVTPEADKILDERGIFVIPEVLANAGGVVVSYFEWVQAIQSYFWQEREVYHRLYRIMRDAFHHVFDISQKEKVNMRMAALMAGVNNVAVASKARGLYP